MKGQQKGLRAAQAVLKVTREELADLLGVSLPTLNSWLLPPTSKAFRPMSKTALLLLERILVDAKRVKK